MTLRIPEYKVVETSTVHDQALEEIINRWVSQGWNYDTIQFVLQPSTRRPVMAFVLFTRDRETLELEDSETPGFDAQEE